jgi:hypothetical protein
MWLQAEQATKPGTARFPSDELKIIFLGAGFESLKIQKIPVTDQSEIDPGPGKQEEAIRLFRGWEFYDHAEKLRANSPKLAELKNLIQATLADNDPAKKPTDGPRGPTSTTQSSTAPIALALF